MMVSEFIQYLQKQPQNAHVKISVAYSAVWCDLSIEESYLGKDGNLYLEGDM